MVDGNHDHYNQRLLSNPSYSSNMTTFHSRSNDDGWVFLPKAAPIIDDVGIMGCNGWYDWNIDPNVSYDTQRRIWGQNMADSRLIQFEGDFPDDLADNDVWWMTESYDNFYTVPSVKSVIAVTHTVPHKRGMFIHPTDDRWNMLSGSFYNNGMEYIFNGIVSNPSHKLKVWLFGHTHFTYDFDVGGCRFVCNPRGYPKERSGIYQPITIEV